MLTNCIAKAKLVYNKKVKAYKLVVAFNAHKTITPAGKVKYAFPTQAKCAYVSGDLLAKNLQAELTKVLPHVQKQLRTTNIQFVD